MNSRFSGDWMTTVFYTYSEINHERPPLQMLSNKCQMPWDGDANRGLTSINLVLHLSFMQLSPALNPSPKSEDSVMSDWFSRIQDPTYRRVRIESINLKETVWSHRLCMMSKMGSRFREFQDMLRLVSDLRRTELNMFSFCGICP